MRSGAVLSALAARGSPTLSFTALLLYCCAAVLLYCFTALLRYCPPPGTHVACGAELDDLSRGALELMRRWMPCGRALQNKKKINTNTIQSCGIVVKLDAMRAAPPTSHLCTLRFQDTCPQRGIMARCGPIKTTRDTCPSRGSVTRLRVRRAYKSRINDTRDICSERGKEAKRQYVNMARMRP